VTDPQMDLRRPYRRRWIVRLVAAPMAASFILGGVGLLIAQLQGFPVDPFAFAVPVLGVLMLAAWIIDEVRLAQNHELLRAMVAAGRVDWAARVYGRRWYWRLGLVGGGLLLLGCGVGVLQPSPDIVGDLRVEYVQCHGGLCDVLGQFRSDTGDIAFPARATVTADEGISVGSVVRVKQIDDVRVTTDLSRPAATPDWAVAIEPFLVAVVLLAEWVYLEVRIRPARALIKRSRAASSTMSPGASLIDAAGGVVFTDSE
jgi:hypothetical protein